MAEESAHVYQNRRQLEALRLAADPTDSLQGFRQRRSQDEPRCAMLPVTSVSVLARCRRQARSCGPFRQPGSASSLPEAAQSYPPLSMSAIALADGLG